jgi:aspartyl protease family protein
MLIRSLLGCLLCCILPIICHAGDIQVLGLFKDQVILQQGNETLNLRVGEEKGNVKVIDANSYQCTIEVNGQQQILTLGNQVNINVKRHTTPTIRIEKDNRGLYKTSGSINGSYVNFIVDTGASMVSMNTNHAKTLGIDYSKSKPISVETAGGKTKGYLVDINQIHVGEISLYNVPGVVLESQVPVDILLGMSFLKRMKMTEENNLLEIKQQY